MTDLLFRRFLERFPQINGVERVSVYGAMERIYLDLFDGAFLGARPFSSHDSIRRIALKIFDVPFLYALRGDIGPAVFFEPRGMEEYARNHTHHCLQVHLPNPHPVITISTHNRGAGVLLGRQRDNYFRFVTGVFDEFVANARPI